MIPCEPGTYCDDTGIQKYCAPGKYGVQQKQTSETDACQPCSAGTYQPGEGSRNCVDCNRGKFNDKPQQTDEKKACVPCPSGRYCPDRGEATATQCPKGQYQNEEKNVACVKCGIGRYNDEEGSAAQTACVECPVDDQNNKQITLREGEEAVSACKVTPRSCERGQRPVKIDDCEPCRPGFYGNKQGTRCMLCRVGR